MTPHRRSRQHLALWRKRRRADFRRILLLAFVTLFLIPLMAIPAVAASTVGPLPAVDGLSSSGMEQDTLIYDRNGGLLADIGKQGDHRIVVPLKSMSPFLKQKTGPSTTTAASTWVESFEPPGPITRTITSIRAVARSASSW